MPDPIVFIWNDGPFADRIRLLGHTVLATRDDLRTHQRRSKLRDRPLVVLAEWAATTGRLADLEGLKHIVELFESERIVPKIALCSFRARGELVHLGDARGEAARLMFPFVRLPATPAQMAEAAAAASPPSRMVQVWLRDHVLSRNPFAMIVHDLNNAANIGLDEFRRGLERLAITVQARRGIFAETMPDVGEFEQLLQAGIEFAGQQNSSAAAEIQQRMVQALNAAQGRVRSNGDAIRRAPFSVLVVEDEERWRQEITEGLTPFFTEVAGYGSGVAALQVLRERSQAGKPFDAVISDWALREQHDDDGILQPLQGPDVLLQAAEICRGPLVGLTSLPPDVVATILNAAPDDARARLSWFPKPPGSGKHDYAGLAHLVATKAWESLGLREQTPTGKPWREHGLADHYASVRMWGAEQQRAFFADCATKAQTVIDAYRSGTQTQDVSAPPHSLNFNPASGGARYTFQRFEGVLVARLVVLELYAQQSRHSRDYRAVLATLHPKLAESACEKAIQTGRSTDGVYPTSFETGMLPTLGLPRKGNRIDVGKLKLMPHEDVWVREKGLDLGLPPVLAAGQEGEATSLATDIEGIISGTKQRLPHLVIEETELGAMFEGCSTTMRLGEESVVLMEALVSALRKLGEDPAVYAEYPRLTREIDALTEEGVYEDLYSKLPDWKRRLTALIHLMK